jgi:hypothetical protein
MQRQFWFLPDSPRTLAFLIALTLVLGGSPGSNEVHGQKRPATRIDLAVRRAMRDGREPAVRVIVGTRRGREALEAKVKRRGNTVHSDHPSIGSFAATVSAAGLASLANDPDVSSLSIDAIVFSDTKRDKQATRDQKPATRDNKGKQETPDNAVRASILWTPMIPNAKSSINRAPD